MQVGPSASMAGKFFGLREREREREREKDKKRERERERATASPCGVDGDGRADILRQRVIAVHDLDLARGARTLQQSWAGREGGQTIGQDTEVISYQRL